MRGGLVAILFLVACSGGAPSADAGPDASRGDASRPLRDAGCGPVAPAGPGPECVLETCSGGRECVNGPCPYPCCVGGRLEVCEIGTGLECAAPAPMDCGMGTCVSAGEPCP